MSIRSILCVIALSFAPIAALAGSVPGQDISACASITWSEQTQLDSHATISYVDETGSAVQEASVVPASVRVVGPASLASAGPAVSFVAPAEGARPYFTVTRSLYCGPSLVGNIVKLAGTVRSSDGYLYLDDGATRPDSAPAAALLRTDLLTDKPAEGRFVIVEGICRKEDSGQISILPLDDSAIACVR